MLRIKTLNFIQFRYFASCSKYLAMSREERVNTSFGTMEFGRRADVSESKAMVQMCLDNGCYEFDTASLYSDGETETIIGKIGLFRDPKIIIATKASPQSNQGLKYDGVLEQMNTSLRRMKRTSVDIFYLHSPDHKTPIEETLKAVDHLHKEGKFKEFGLSNYAAWEVAEIYYLCKAHNYVLPTLYQGMYNALTREIEKELMPCLRRFEMRFYAYNPLAGGIMTGKYQYTDKDEKKPYGRFFGTGTWTQPYRDRYWKKPLFNVLDKTKLDEVYGEGQVSLAEASLRWLYHHSMMAGKYGDIVILGASNTKQLEENLQASKKGSLHQDIVKLFDEGWDHIKGTCPSYSR